MFALLTAIAAETQHGCYKRVHKAGYNGPVFLYTVGMEHTGHHFWSSLFENSDVQTNFPSVSYASNVSSANTVVTFVHPFGCVQKASSSHAEQLARAFRNDIEASQQSPGSRTRMLWIKSGSYPSGGNHDPAFTPLQAFSSLAARTPPNWQAIERARVKRKGKGAEETLFHASPDINALAVAAELAKVDLRFVILLRKTSETVYTFTTQRLNVLARHCQIMLEQLRSLSSHYYTCSPYGPYGDWTPRVSRFIKTRVNASLYANKFHKSTRHDSDYLKLKGLSLQQRAIYERYEACHTSVGSLCKPHDGL